MLEEFQQRSGDRFDCFIQPCMVWISHPFEKSLVGEYAIKSSFNVVDIVFEHFLVIENAYTKILVKHLGIYTAAKIEQVVNVFVSR